METNKINEIKIKKLTQDLRNNRDDDFLENFHEEQEPWLMSYADMMTLLFCFFVILTSLANFDPVNMAQLSKEVANYISDGELDREEEEIKDLQKDVATNSKLEGVAITAVKDGSMEMVFNTTILYPAPNSFESDDSYFENLDVLVGLIKNRSADYRVIVEAHTDTQDQGKWKDGNSHWEVSAKRAGQVINRFIGQGFTPNQLVAVGYGNSRPVASSVDKFGREIEENQNLNRRVVIKVLQPMRGKRIRNSHLENYFEDQEILDE